MNFATRIQNLKSEGAYRVMGLAQALEKEGRDIVHLEIGQPDFNTFPPIAEEGKKAIDAGFTRYNPSEGYADLREAIANYSKTRGIRTSPSQVVVGPGAKPVLLFPLLGASRKRGRGSFPGSRISFLPCRYRNSRRCTSSSTVGGGQQFLFRLGRTRKSHHGKNETSHTEFSRQSHRWSHLKGRLDGNRRPR